jgi:hypothetical protein
MAKTKSNFLSKYVMDKAIFIFTLFKSIPNLIALIEIEANAARKSFVLILILYLIAGVLLTSTWLSILAMYFIYLVSLPLSSMASIFIIIAINIFLLGLIIAMILKSKKNLSFPKTRRLLRHSIKR